MGRDWQVSLLHVAFRINIIHLRGGMLMLIMDNSGTVKSIQWDVIGTF